MSAPKNMSDATCRREFVRRNHTCVVSYARKTAPPSMSIVHYAMDGDDIVFLTMSERQKAKAVRRLGQLSLCVLDGEQGGLSWPPEYLVVDGKATISEDMDYVLEQALKIVPVMTGNELTKEAIPVVRQVLERERRVVVRVTPESTFHSPAVHPDDEEEVMEAGKSDKPLHGLGARLPWKDPE